MADDAASLCSGDDRAEWDSVRPFLDTISELDGIDLDDICQLGDISNTAQYDLHQDSDDTLPDFEDHDLQHDRTERWLNDSHAPVAFSVALPVETRPIPEDQDEGVFRVIRGMFTGAILLETAANTLLDKTASVECPSREFSQAFSQALRCLDDQDHCGVGDRHWYVIIL